MVSFRKYFPVFEKKIYLDYAAVSPFSIFHKDFFLEAYNLQEKFDFDIIERLKFLKENLKEKISEFIGAESKDNIALIPNTSYGLSSIASGMDLKKGDRILIPSIEFPANVYPFLYLKSKGVEVDFVESVNGIISINEIKKSIKNNTKVFSISFVQFLNGYRAQLDEIGDFCKNNGIFFLVDGIQGVGSCPLNVNLSNIDGLSCGGAKWLM